MSQTGKLNEPVPSLSTRIQNRTAPTRERGTIVATAVPDVTELGFAWESRVRDQPVHPSGTAGATIGTIVATAVPDMTEPGFA